MSIKGFKDKYKPGDIFYGIIVLEDIPLIPLKFLIIDVHTEEHKFSEGDSITTYNYITKCTEILDFNFEEFLPGMKYLDTISITSSDCSYGILLIIDDIDYITGKKNKTIVIGMDTEDFIVRSRRSDIKKLYNNLSKGKDIMKDKYMSIKTIHTYFKHDE